MDQSHNVAILLHVSIPASACLQTQKIRLIAVGFPGVILYVNCSSFVPVLLSLQEPAASALPHWTRRPEENLSIP
jgi:hypothetical protein